MFHDVGQLSNGHNSFKIIVESVVPKSGWMGNRTRPHDHIVLLVDLSRKVVFHFRLYFMTMIGIQQWISRPWIELTGWVRQSK